MDRKRIAKTAAALAWLPVPLAIFFLFRFSPSYRAVLLLLSLTVHEAGHCVAFALLGFGAPRLLPAPGGFRLFSAAPLSYREERTVALAGPAADLIPGMLLLICGSGDPYFAEAGWIFIGTGLSNLIPIADHDGGRVLFCLLAPSLGSARAGKIAGAASTISLLLSLTLSFSLLYAWGAGFYFSVFCLFSLLSHPLPKDNFF